MVKKICSKRNLPLRNRLSFSLPNRRTPADSSQESPLQESDDFWKRNPTKSYTDPDVPIETTHRLQRRCHAIHFQTRYKFLDGRKTCICSNGTPYSWPDKCYENIWVGVHGKESICMVTLNRDLVLAKTPVHPSFQHRPLNLQTMGKCAFGAEYVCMREFAAAVISEVQCLPFDDYKLRERIGQSFEKPYGVVSVIPCTLPEGSGHEALNDEENAINFLKDKMKSNSEFMFDETVQTAISAFQRLCPKELKAEDIWVTTAWNEEGTIEHMEVPEKKEHLAIISGGSSGDRPPTKNPAVPKLVDLPGVTVRNGCHEYCVPTNFFESFKRVPCFGGEGGFSGDVDQLPPPSVAAVFPNCSWSYAPPDSLGIRRLNFCSFSYKND